MTTAHTATPWQLTHGRPTEICDADGEVRGCGPIALAHGDSSVVNKANAEFIVTACNAHDDLIAAVRAFVHYDDDDDDHEDGVAVMINYADAISRARAILVKLGAA